MSPSNVSSRGANAVTVRLVAAVLRFVVVPFRGRNLALALTVASFAACGGTTVREDGTIVSGGGTGGAQYPFGGTTGALGGSGGSWDVRPGAGGLVGLGGGGYIPPGIGGYVPPGWGGTTVPLPYGGSPPVYGGSPGLGGAPPVAGGSGGWVVAGGAAGEGPPLAGYAGLAGLAGIAGWGGEAPPLAGSAGVAGLGPVGGNGGLAGAGGLGGAGGGTCSDGVRNGNEEDVDCGGRCPACVVPCTCIVGTDCPSLVCIDCQCVPPECDDGVANGDETDVDCGGSTCSPCADGEHCSTHADCVSSNCFAGVCGGPPSCASGLECNGESCCSSVQVPGGSFPMGRGSETCADCVDGCPATMACSSNEEPEHPTSVSTFALDTYEVTVGRFRAFVNAGFAPPSAGMGAHPLIAGSGWDTAWNAAYPADLTALVADLQSGADCSWTETVGGNETHAINCVSWYEAFAFCVWDGARLPTEAEWEYVAAGGDENRFYPWGAIEPTAEHANYGVSGSSAVAVGSASLGIGRWGHRDLAGNVYEWTLDGYSLDYYSAVTTGCDDCANLDVTSERSIRGGGWTSSEFGLRPAHRDGLSADLVSALVGFRCARDP